MRDRDNHELLEAARVVDSQASDNSDIGIPVDPDVADYMGAFEDPAITLEDIEEDS